MPPPVTELVRRPSLRPAAPRLFPSAAGSSRAGAPNEAGATTAASAPPRRGRFDGCVKMPNSPTCERWTPPGSSETQRNTLQCTRRGCTSAASSSSTTLPVGAGPAASAGPAAPSWSAAASGSGAVKRFSSSQWRRASLLAVLDSCSSRGDGSCGDEPSILRPASPPAALGSPAQRGATEAPTRGVRQDGSGSASVFLISRQNAHLSEQHARRPVFLSRAPPGAVSAAAGGAGDSSAGAAHAVQDSVPQHWRWQRKQPVSLRAPHAPS